MATNVSSLSSSSNLINLTKVTNDLKKTNDRLSSGKRINRASDDPAGAAIAAQLLANADSGAVAARNISDAVSVADIADGALSSVADITTRLNELATQASNGTLSDTERGALNQEFQSLKSELDRISNTTEFNGQQLLSGSGASLNIQAGTDGSANSQITLQTVGVSAQSLGLGSADISTQAGAQAALDLAKQAVSNVAQNRGEIGSVVSRLDTAYSNIKTSELNQRSAEDQITSADFATETTNRTKYSILQQADIAVAAQAKQSAANVLKLIS